MDILQEASIFEKAKMSHMSTSDRVSASREAKRLVLAINEIYKKTKDSSFASHSGYFSRGSHESAIDSTIS